MAPGDVFSGAASRETLTVIVDAKTKGTGNFNRFTANISYAYHIGLSAQTSLAAGFAGGITLVGLNTNGKAFFGSDPVDPAVGGSVHTNY